MVEINGLVRREIHDLAVARHHESPVVLLEGPRAVGKSTLLRQLADELDGRLLDLDDLDTRTALIRDPGTMIEADGVVLIDEYQRAPMVLDAIKARLNKDGRPGQFILTGSARHEALPRAAQALTGRLQRLAVNPLAQCELEGTPGLVRELLDQPDATVAQGPGGRASRDEYVARVSRGGFPLALAAGTDRARWRWIDNYVRLMLERDVRDLSKVRAAHALPAILERLAGQSAQVLNLAKVAEGTGVDATTARDYVRLLEAVFLVQILPAWDRTLTRRTAARPKVHLIDTGVATRLLRLTPDKMARRTPTALTEFGHALETFVVGELLKEASWTDEIAGVGHWRTRDGHEVDLVLETDDGSVIAFEVKSASRVSGDDFRGLRRLKETLGEDFRAGFVLYAGERSYTYEDGLHVLPIDSLWCGERRDGRNGRSSLA